MRGTLHNFSVTLSLIVLLSLAFAEVSATPESYPESRPFQDDTLAMGTADSIAHKNENPAKAQTNGRPSKKTFWEKPLINWQTGGLLGATALGGAFLWIASKHNDNNGKPSEDIFPQDPGSPVGGNRN
ncbi:MAG TPA: hypothetical protein VJ385_06140 [Fibrobacteria bacterium]|nr:hypothetical protein [Fibrobacteria bacterium]